MTPKGEGYIVLPTLLKVILSKHNDDFCLKCPHSFRTENKLKSHKILCENKDFFKFMFILKKRSEGSKSFIWLE